MDLAAALAFSRYVAQALAADPSANDNLAGSLDSAFDWSAAESEIAALARDDDASALAKGLRVLRRRLLIHTILRDLTGRADLLEVCAAVTHLAELSLRAAVTLHHAQLAERHGAPRSRSGAPQDLIVIAMGKLGGGELNVSSDVDLVFIYPEDGETARAPALANSEFFDRLGKRVIAALQEVTADGYVFRVDMRLRPYGESGPLTLPLIALEQYLVAQGRAWERYAWLKARALTGSHHEEIASVVTPFVFRKYLDFDVYDGLRDIHRQIREQGRRRDYQPNIKLGPGGIREIEFTVQALQIVRGGREPELRERGTLPAIRALAARGLLPESAAAALESAYVFLRNLEHRLQYRDDRQTQTLPHHDEREGLAQAMGFADTTSFEAALAAHRAEVEAHFAAVFDEPLSRAGATAIATASAEPDAQMLAAIWRGDVSEETALQALAKAGFTDARSVVDTLTRVRKSTRYLQLPATSRRRFDAIGPQLLAVATSEASTADDAQTVFARLLALLEAVSRRSSYLALIVEHPPLLPRLAHLMSSSAWAADYLTRHPILLDELLDARVLLADIDSATWPGELARLLALHPMDAERQMDTLRHFQHAQTFRLLAQDLAGMLTVERLADHLSALADTTLAATLREAWTQMPDHVRAAPASPPHFAIIGYGKLGGKELGYASDLDIVFLYDDNDENAAVRYARLAQRLVTWLTSTTAAGPLYDIDVRLRPDGAAGLTVSSLAGFRRYQREHAWTWEHQALTRARFVAGDATLGGTFEAEREAILQLPRDAAKLRAEVVEMRRKMHAGHPNRSPSFDLKHDAGGMVDVEFSVQFLVLGHAHDHPELTRNAGNIALLLLCADLGLLPDALAHDVADAYRGYRRLQHQLRLAGATHARVDPQTQAQQRARVTALWAHVFGEPWR